VKKVSPKVALERITTLLRVWGTLRANRSFYGMTLEEFAQRVKPSLDTRAELDAIDERRNATAVRRDVSDVDAMEVIQRIVNAIKADADEGEDGEVYAALGYVRKAHRANGRPRNPPQVTAQPNESADGKAKEGENDKEAA
jgi:hypothetical protein